MSTIWEKDIKYFLVKYLWADRNTRLSFSRFNVEGRENIPTDGAVLLVPNHCNTLMDAMVILKAIPGASAYGARADIFKNKTAAAGLKFLKIVPLARQKDGASAVMQNYAVFDEVVDIIDHDVPFCLYGEGTHHASHTVNPMKKGVWRIAQRAQETLGKDVYIIPVGLDYEFFFRPSTAIDVRFGKAIKFSDIQADGPLKFGQMLHDRIQELVRRKDLDYIEPDGSFHFYKAPKLSPGKTILKALGGILILPFAVLWTVLGFPMDLISTLIIGKMKDKTWSNTVRFVVRFFCLVLLTLIYTPLAFIFLPWYCAIVLVVLLWFSDTALQWHKNYYKDLFIHE